MVKDKNEDVTSKFKKVTEQKLHRASQWPLQPSDVDINIHFVSQGGSKTLVSPTQFVHEDSTLIGPEMPCSLFQAEIGFYLLTCLLPQLCSSMPNLSALFSILLVPPFHQDLLPEAAHPLAQITLMHGYCPGQFFPGLAPLFPTSQIFLLGVFHFLICLLRIV